MIIMTLVELNGNKLFNTLCNFSFIKCRNVKQNQRLESINDAYWLFDVVVFLKYPLLHVVTMGSLSYYYYLIPWMKLHKRKGLV